MSKKIHLGRLWWQAVTDAERLHVTQRMLIDPTRPDACNPHILTSVAHELEVREGICRALAWMLDHEDQIAVIMKQERTST
jgi:hypothetical protein